MTLVARHRCCAAGRAGISKAPASTSGQRPGVLVMTALQKISDEQANEISHMCRQVPMVTLRGLHGHFSHHQRIETERFITLFASQKGLHGQCTAAAILQVQCR